MRALAKLIELNDGGVDRAHRVGLTWDTRWTTYLAIPGAAATTTVLAWSAYGGPRLVAWAVAVCLPLLLLLVVPARPWSERDAMVAEVVHSVVAFLVAALFSLFWWWFGLWDDRVPQMLVAMLPLGMVMAFAAISAATTPVFLAAGAGTILHPLPFLFREDFSLVLLLGVPLSVAVLVFHLDQRRQVLERLRERGRSASLLAEVGTVLDAAPTPLLQTEGGRVLRWNRALAALLEVPDDDLAAADLTTLLGVPAEPMTRRRARVGTPDGTGIEVEISAVPVPSHPDRLVWTVEDVTDRVRRERLMRRMAEYDELTGLPNRRGIAAYARSLDRDRTIGLLLIDLDGFKEVNDGLGHEVGDKVLVELAARIKATLRSGDAVARLGGDELVVAVLDPGSVEEVEAVGVRIVEVCAAPLDIDGRAVRVGASVGVAVGSTRKGGSDILVAADEAMYDAKRRGGNRVRVHPSSRSVRLERRGRPRSGTAADRAG